MSGHISGRASQNFWSPHWPIFIVKILILPCLHKIKIGFLKLLYNIILGYLKDSNAAAHSVDTGTSYAVELKRIENDIECPIYMLEGTRIITISL